MDLEELLGKCTGQAPRFPRVLEVEILCGAAFSVFQLGERKSPSRKSEKSIFIRAK